MKSIISLLLLTLYLLQGLKSCNTNTIKSFNTIPEASIIFDLDQNININNVLILKWEHNDTTAALIRTGKISYVNSLNYSSKYQLYENGSFEIKKIQNEDHGKYLSTITDGNGKKYETTYLLFVYEPVSLPIIKQVDMSGTSGNLICNITLECATQNGTNVTFSWKKEKFHMVYTIVHNGRIFQDIMEDNVTTTYTCEASNPVSSRSASVNITKDCHEAKPVPLWIWLVAAVGGILLFALLLTEILVICRRKKKNSRQEDINFYYDTCQNNKNEGIQPMSPDGSLSLYATIHDVDLMSSSPHPKKKDCVTVYSAVSSVKNMSSPPQPKKKDCVTIYTAVSSINNKRESKRLASSMDPSVSLYSVVQLPERQKEMSHYEMS